MYSKHSVKTKACLFNKSDLQKLRTLAVRATSTKGNQQNYPLASTYFLLEMEDLAMYGEASKLQIIANVEANEHYNTWRGNSSEKRNEYLN